MVNNAYFFHKGPRCGGSQSPVTPAPGIQWLLLASTGTCAHIYTETELKIKLIFRTIKLHSHEGVHFSLYPVWPAWLGCLASVLRCRNEDETVAISDTPSQGYLEASAQATETSLKWTFNPWPQTANFGMTTQLLPAMASLGLTPRTRLFIISPGNWVWPERKTASRLIAVGVVENISA